MGDIVSFLFIVLTKMLLSTEDIRANDAELSAIVLNKLLKKSQLLMFGVSILLFLVQSIVCPSLG